ncbi:MULTISPECIES: FAD-binding oxidoreductase [unclassified Leifsonia]|uniref:FAD-binding oxidoreductase n=1 Tax=unclassified Leifsonia TaxID=2663824 RepID=UPI0006F3A24E|nr:MULTISPECIES: FAD-linked oxidase C-terminal domain-containing protein [unclassified Leifsonia]KQX06592.1 FAD-linked oxidase [Leifsonia sp. Root1293]KRA10876.1 FAD-linked oxidase [Leifsonia sp. Root60]
MATIDLLRAALGDPQGEHTVVTDDAVLAAARADRSGFVAAETALAVVYAASIDAVQATLRFASEHSIPVVPRGAGTGLAGGAIGSAGAIVLDVSRMNRILEIDAENELAVVEPGVINDALNAAATPLGLWFAPDPASKAISSVGGNIATNAGGLLCAKYGVTREAVLGLAVVLADGRLIRTGHRTVKGVTGYDLTALFTGSEGTLGVIVEATVRLRPLPDGAPVTLGVFFPDVAAAAAAAASVTAARLRPAVMELIDPVALAFIRAHLGSEAFVGTPLDGSPLDSATGGAADAPAFLLVQFDGPAAAAEAEAALPVLVAAGGAAQLAADAAAGERLLAIRRAFHASVAAGGEVLIEDVSVPRSRMAEMFVTIAEIGDRHGLAIPTVAHAGDGNLHPNFIYAGDSVPDAVWQAADELFRAALALGGTLTGEHGVGLLKRRWLADELGDDSYGLQRELKRVFDPQGILNPGKVFAE